MRLPIKSFIGSNRENQKQMINHLSLSGDYFEKYPKETKIEIEKENIVYLSHHDNQENKTYHQKIKR